MQENQTRLLTVAQAAERLGRTPAALRFMIHAGNAPTSAMVGGRRMFREADIETYIALAFGEVS
jgi:excisionase family DNA binding protein